MKTEVILKYPLQMLFSVFSLSLPWILAIPQYTFDVKLSTPPTTANLSKGEDPQV